MLKQEQMKGKMRGSWMIYQQGAFMVRAYEIA
jgi:hypothetical protein